MLQQIALNLDGKHPINPILKPTLFIIKMKPNLH